MNDAQLLRFSRQIMLPQMGIEGQQRLLDARVMIIGLGGLGSPVALYLAAAGVGELVLVDFDKVDLSNLQRQIIHRTDAIGQPKVESAQATLAGINPECRITPLNALLDEEELARQVAKVDLVLDCCDNFQTRFAINRVCVAQRKPLVSGAAIRLEGQVALFSGQPGDPCYHCLYGMEGELEESCTENGVLSPLVGVIGSMQAVEAIKLLAGFGQPLIGKLALYDAMRGDWRTLRLKADPGCSVCSGRQ
jgi:adenylyltransferase/sulfurtransferase